MPCGRFAPTPSGALHLGSARTALAAERISRARGESFVLRVEDLDDARTRPGATAAMLADLAWLGLRWDEGPDVGGRSQPYVQSERRPLYDAALQVLRDAGRAYPCACSRRDIESASQAPHGAEARYPGTCANRDAAEVIERAASKGRGVAWRFRAPDEDIEVSDGVLGIATQNVAREVGDFVLYRADGVAAYQLAVVVDDIAMGVTSVVRGDDLWSSTARQLLVYRAFGATAPSYVHVPLVVGDDGVRLAKRHGSISIATLRDRGVSASRMRDALSVGLDDDPARIVREPLALSVVRRTIPEIGP